MELPSDRRGWLKVVGVLVGLFVAYMLVKRLLPDVDPQQILEDVSDSLGAWTYGLVALLAFLETGAFVGLIAPGETFVVLAGAVAGQGATSVVLTIGIVWVSAFLGDTASFYLGHRLGRNFVLEHGPKLRITRERFAQVEEYFAKHGGKTILIGRFIGLVRALAPFVAGSSKMPYRAMAPYSVLGTGIWATTFTLLGYFASKNIEAVLENSERAILGFGLFVGLVVGGIVLVKYLKQEENRKHVAAEMEKRPVLRSLLALGRRISPQARFLGERLTPGGLGLEFTTAMAALAVSSYICIGYALLFGDDPGPTAGDTAAADLVSELRASWLTDVAEVVTALGSTPAVLVVTLATGAWLAIRRSWPELVILLVGVVAIIAGTDLFKEIVERPRPEGGLIEVDNFAYPSAHASNAVIYAWVALTVSLRSRAGFAEGSAVVVVGLVIAAAIGLSRVYLGVHYLSDVNGGWAFGVAIFALLSAVAVAVGYFRQDGDADGA